MKYGIVSAETVLKDLNAWETLYIAGRMHKPVLVLLFSFLFFSSIFLDFLDERMS